MGTYGHRRSTPPSLVVVLVLSTFAALPSTVGAEGFAPRVPLANRVLTWACVYAHRPVVELERSPAGLLVIDPDAYSASDVARLQRGNRLVFAYLSLGEAEAYRSYFADPTLKPLLGAENPNWPGNFPVALHAPTWRTLVTRYAQQILAKGFDGLVTDVVDAWENAPNRETARRQTADLVIAVAQTMRATRSDRYLLVLNSTGLFAEPGIDAEVDGVIQEGLFYSWQPGGMPAAQQRTKLAALTRLRTAGKFVALLEYTRRDRQVREIRQHARRHGFIGYCSNRNLDQLFPLP